MGEERQYARYTYTGLRAGGSGKFRHRYLDPDGEERFWAKPFGSTVGAVYLVAYDGDYGTVYPGTARYAGEYEAPDAGAEIAAWRAEDRAAKATQEAYRAEKRLKADGGNLDALTLGEVKEMMRGRLGHQRQGLMVAVMNYLSGGF